ncbi:MAG: hypothetical protein HY534_05185 [Chloroflexi bacterium]|nr:hypothetical protein [Chloroflexota bacterium]
MGQPPDGPWYFIARGESRILISVRGASVLSAYLAPGEGRAFAFLEGIACDPIDPGYVAPPRGRPFILAAPNPVPAGSGSGATTLTWDLGEKGKCLYGGVYVSEDGGPLKVFARAEAGTAQAPWIAAGHEYRFVLGRSTPISRVPEQLAEVRVRRIGG